MAQVPYSGVPDVVEREAPVGPVRINATPDMFGEAVGRSLEFAGGVATQSGNELFNRAMAMQELHNQTVARDAQAQYMSQQGQLHADFTSKQGADAGPQALQGYIKQSNDLRGQISNGIDSPAARQMFDNDSMNFLGRNIFNAAGHSAQQMKNYAIGTSKALIDNTANQALSNPGDEISFKASLVTQRQNAQQLAAQMGYQPGSPEAQDVEDKAVSTLVGSRIAGYARTQPLLAKQLYQSAIQDGSLRGEDIAHVGNMVNNQVMTGGSKLVADGVNDGSGMLLGKGQVSIQRAADAIKGIESSGNYMTVGRPDKNGNVPLGAYGIMSNNLPQWLKDSGLPPMSAADFLKNNAAQDKVFETKFGEAQQQHGNANDAASIWLSGRPMAQAGNASDSLGTSVPAYIQKFNAALAKSASLDEKVSAAQAHMGELAPDVPLAQDAVKERMIQKAREDQAQATLADRQAQSTLDTALAGIQGKTPGTFDDWLHSSPDLAKTFYSLDGQKQLSVMQKYRQQVASDDLPSPVRDQNRKALTGLSYSDPDKFQSTNLYSQDLTATDRKALVGIQAGMVRGAGRDPEVSRALGVLKTQMDAAGVQNTADTRADYDQFVGALHDEMGVFQRQNARPPNDSDIATIGRRLLTETTLSKGMFGGVFGDNKGPLYQMQPPEDVAARIKQRVPNASPDQIRSIYLRMQYNALTKKEQAGG